MARPTRSNINQNNEALLRNDVPFFWRGHDWTDVGRRGAVVEDEDKPVGVVVLYDRRTHRAVPVVSNEFRSDMMVTKKTNQMIEEWLHINRKPTGIGEST